MWSSTECSGDGGLVGRLTQVARTGNYRHPYLTPPPPPNPNRDPNPTSSPTPNQAGSADYLHTVGRTCSAPEDEVAVRCCADTQLYPPAPPLVTLEPPRGLRVVQSSCTNVRSTSSVVRSEW